jgi:hypothetical protein
MRKKYMGNPWDFITTSYRGLKSPKKDEIPTQLTVMIKDAQHSKSRNGWLWIVKDVKMGEETIIDYEFCKEIQVILQTLTVVTTKKCESHPSNLMPLEG